MSLELSPTEAKALTLGHLWGLISRERIIHIAEKAIMDCPTVPSGEICVLALCITDHQVETRLSKFTTGAGKWQAVQALLSKYVSIADLEEAERTKLYYYISNYADWDDEYPWRKIKILTHELSDAKLGVYGDETEISEEILEIINDAIDN